MMGAAAMAVNVSHALGETSAGFVLSYAAIRFLLVVEYVRIGRRIPSTKPLTERYSVGFASSAVIWTISAFVPPPLRFILWDSHSKNKKNTFSDFNTVSLEKTESIPFSLWWIYFDNIGGSAIRAATEKGKRGILYLAVRTLPISSWAYSNWYWHKTSSIK